MAVENRLDPAAMDADLRWQSGTKFVIPERALLLLGTQLFWIPALRCGRDGNQNAGHEINGPDAE